MYRVLRCWPGLLLVSGLLVLTLLLDRLFDLGRIGMSPAATGILLGVLAGNLFPPHHSGAFKAGIEFAQKHLLRWGIVLFGLHLSWQQIIALGRGGVAADMVMVLTTLALGLWLGRRLFGLDTETALLTAVGSAICGAAAIAAIAPLLEAKTEKVTAAVGTVVLFGTLGMVIYPLINHWGPTSLHPVFGTYVGSTVHEVAQVVAIGSGLDDNAASGAVVVKMLRVLMLMPCLLLIGLRRAKGSPGNVVAQIPWFALGFIAMAGINSMGWLPIAMIEGGQRLGGFLLAAAMIALGLGTTLPRIRAAGVAPLLLAGVLFVHLIITGALVNRWLA